MGFSGGGWGGVWWCGGVGWGCGVGVVTSLWHGGVHCCDPLPFHFIHYSLLSCPDADPAPGPSMDDKQTDGRLWGDENTTINGGSLGSCIDEERSKVR